MFWRPPRRPNLIGGSQQWGQADNQFAQPPQVNPMMDSLNPSVGMMNKPQFGIGAGMGGGQSVGMMNKPPMFQQDPMQQQSPMFNTMPVDRRMPVDRGWDRSEGMSKYLNSIRPQDEPQGIDAEGYKTTGYAAGGTGRYPGVYT